MQKTVPGGGIKLDRRDFLALDGIDQKGRGRGRGQQSRAKLAAGPQRKLAPGIEDLRGQIGAAHFSNGSRRLGLNERRLIGAKQPGEDRSGQLGLPAPQRLNAR